MYSSVIKNKNWFLCVISHIRITLGNTLSFVNCVSVYFSFFFLPNFVVFFFFSPENVIVVLRGK